MPLKKPPVPKLPSMEVYVKDRSLKFRDAKPGDDILEDITITKNDSNWAIPCDPMRCAVANALQRKGYIAVVGKTMIKAHKVGTNTVYRLETSPELKRVIYSLDRDGTPVPPKTYELRPCSPANTLAAVRVRMNTLARARRKASSSTRPAHRSKKKRVFLVAKRTASIPGSLHR